MTPSEIRIRFAGMAANLRPALRRTLERETILLQRHVVEDKLSGQVLNVRTGTGRRSITATVEDGPGGSLVGRVGTNLGYMIANEFGAQIPEIRPVHAKALHWMSPTGESVFAMRAAAHTLPERSFLRSALADRHDAIVAAFRNTVLALARGEEEPRG